MKDHHRRHYHHCRHFVPHLSVRLQVDPRLREILLDLYVHSAFGFDRTSSTSRGLEYPQRASEWPRIRRQFPDHLGHQFL